MEHDFVGSEEQRLLRTANDALFDLQKHVEYLGFNVAGHYAFEARSVLGKAENIIRIAYKSGALPKEIA
jgi:hypothetical protein